MSAKTIKDKLTKSHKSPVKSADLVGTGSTVLNLACSDRIQGGFPKGCYILAVGDSSSGKTFIALTCLAEASINPVFDNYRLIYDNAENGALMEMERFFGKRVAAKLEAPRTDSDGLPIFSETIQDFYFHVDDALKGEKPFIYVLDSMDALTSLEDEKKFQDTKKAIRKGKEAPGSYGMSKAKANSQYLRGVVAGLRETGSILVIIVQTRDNTEMMSFEKSTHSGGRALKFYATLQLWSSTVEKIKRTVGGKPRQLGIKTRVKVKKNRITGKERQADITIYHSHGIDDVGACIDYLIDEGAWSVSGQKIKAGEFGEMTKDALIESIESNNQEQELRLLVGKTWKEIEANCDVQRKSRYE